MHRTLGPWWRHRLCAVAVVLASAAGAVAGEIESATPVFVVPELVRAETALPRDVVSLHELLEYRARLAPRLLADHLDFPVLPKPTDDIIRSRLGDPACASFGRDYCILLARPWCDRRAGQVFDFCKAELLRQKIDQSRAEGTIEVPFCTFMYNYDALRRLVQLVPGADPDGAAYLLARLDELHEVGTLILRFKEQTLNGMSRLDDLDDVPAPSGETHPFEALVAASGGMTEDDLRAVLDLHDRDAFVERCLAYTAETLGKDATADDARRHLAGLSPAQAIAAAAFFARSRVQAYAHPGQQLDTLSRGDPAGIEDPWFPQDTLQVGDCRHFAGLTVHYLNQVVKPNNPALAHWYYGIQTTYLRDYHHAYVKAVQVLPGGGIRTFFFDPTILASHETRRLSPGNVRQLIEATARNDHFFQLKRYADDFVLRPVDPDAGLAGPAIDLDHGDGSITVGPLLGNRP